LILQKLPKALQIVADNLKEKDIPYSLIGAFALNSYGLPKYTSDLDLLTEGRFLAEISTIMDRLGYTCFQKTRTFAQFDSELGVYGRIDFMFISTTEGRDILKRSLVVKDEVLGDHPVIQPTDFIILKLMAIANNPLKASHDEGDIVSTLRLFKKDMIPSGFESLDRERIYLFAERFEQKDKFDSLFEKVFSGKNDPDRFEL